MEFKMTKSEQIRLFIAILPYYILGYLKAIPMLIKFYIKSLIIMHRAKKEGNAVCYTNIKEGWWKFTKRLIHQEKEIVLHTAEGNLLFVHGNPSRKIPFNIGGINSTEIELSMKVEKGDYILVSCHNEYHNDIHLNGVHAIREPHTITKYPILATYIPFINKIWLTSSKEVGQLYSEIYPIPLELMEEGYDSTIWKNVERTVRVISEDELPEDIKKLL